MKQAWMISLVLWLVFPAVLFAKAVDSEIAGVTVFTDRAMVMRHAEAAVEKGVNRLVIGTDAVGIDSDSVRAAVYGKGEILGVQVVPVPVLESPRQRIREIEDRIRELEAEKRVLADTGEVLAKQEAFLDELVNFPGRNGGDSRPPLPSAERLEGYLLFFEKKFSKIFEQRRSVDRDISSLEQKIDRLRRELSLYREEQDRTRTGVEILFDAAEPHSVSLEARYQVGRVAWSPVYRATVENDLSGVELSMMAEITQKTGEDWEDAKITVSNAVPVKAGRLPEPSPWWLDYRKPAPVRGDAAKIMRSMESASAAAAEPAGAEVRETALSFEYTLPVPVTIASQEKETLVPLLTRSLEGAFYHYTAPALRADTYLVCEAEADRELLPGPVNIFFENSYTGRMYLSETAPGERFTLGLGIDRSVAVKREKTRDKTEETAFFGRVERDSIIRELSYRITLENRKKAPVSLKVTDRIPVSRTDRIEVKNISFSPEPDRRDVDEKAGVMQWDLVLDPGETSSLRIDFTVTYPRDMPRPVF